MLNSAQNMDSNYWSEVWGANENNLAMVVKSFISMLVGSKKSRAESSMEVDRLFYHSTGIEVLFLYFSKAMIGETWENQRDDKWICV